MNTKELYIGLDLSLNSTGLVILDQDGDVVFERVYESNTKRGKKNNNERTGTPRLEWLADSVVGDICNVTGDMGVLLSNCFPCIEGYSMGSKGGRLANIGEWGGICRLGLYRLGMNTPIVPTPHQLKKFVTGKGAGGKELMMLHAFKKWGVEYVSHDINDAYCLAQMARYAADSTIDRTAYQDETLNKVIEGNNK